MKKITAKEANKICERLGLGYDDGDVTFWAYDEETDEIYDFDSKSQRDKFVEMSKAE